MKETMTQEQLGIYLTDQESSDGRGYAMPMLYSLGRRSDGELRRFATAVERTIMAHPTLLVRITTGDQGIPRFEFREDLQVRVNVEEAASREEVFDLISETGPDRQKRIQPLNLTDRLWVCRLFKTPEGAYFFFSVHHILFDAVSCSLFLERLAHAYETEEAPETEEYTLADVCRRDQEARRSPAFQEALDWYAQHFAVDEFSRFPGLPQTENAHSDFRTEYIPLRVPSNRIEEACARYGIGKSALFNGAFAYLLAMCNYSEEASYATMYHGRSDPRFARTAALMARALPVYVKMRKDETVREYLSSIQAQTREVRRWDTVSTIDLIKKLGWQFRIMFSYDGALSLCPLILEGKEMPAEDLRGQMSGTDISWKVLKQGEGYVHRVIYPHSAMSAETIHALAGYYATILSGLLEKEYIRDVEMLTAEQRTEAIRCSKGRRLELDITRTPVGLISENARLTPDALAVDDDAEQLSYAQLEQRANAMAQRLLREGVQAGDFVGILLERCAAFPVCALAVQKAGAAYLPLDVEYPTERLQYMVQDSQIRVLITTRELLRGRQEVGGFQVERCVFVEDMDWREPVAPVHLSRPDGNAFMIYTSGSTGQPKGAMVHHAGLLNLCASMIEALELTATDRVASHCSFSFDGHVDEMFPTLMAGASLHIMPSGIRKDMDAIVEFLRRHQIQGVNLLTSMGTLLVGRTDLELRYMGLGGEKLSGVVSDKILIYNKYGPTECTDISSLYRLEQGREYADIPIGEPMPNLWCFVVDRFGHLLPPEIPGELCVAGIQVGNGYWHQPEKTAEVFLDCPYVERDDWGRRVRMYHTGDLAQRGRDGLLYFIGRIDSQIKVNGFRVELGEIETRARQIPGIRTAAAKVLKTENVDRLALYYVPEANAALDHAAVREALSKTALPAFMIPELYKKLDALPRTPSGKVDRKNLPEPDYNEDTEIVPPETDAEATLLAILRKLMGTDRFGVTSDLFQMGLSSLSALVLMAEAEEAGIKISLADIAKYRTVRRIAEALPQRQTEEAEAEDTLTEAQARAMLNYVPFSLVTMVENAGIGDVHSPNLFGFDLSVDAQKLCDALNRMAANRSALSIIVGQDAAGRYVWRYDAAFTPHYEVQRLTEAEFEARRASLIQPFEMLGAPLFRAAVFETERRVYLFIDIHHMIMDAGAMMLLYDDIEKAYRGEPLEQDTYCTYIAHQERERTTERYRKAKDELLRMYDDECWRVGFLRDQDTGSPETVYLPCRRVITKAEMLGLAKHLGLSDTLLCTGMILLTMARIDGEGNCLCNICYHNRSNDLTRNALGFLLTWINVAVKVRRSMSVAEFYRELQASWIASTEKLCAGMDATAYSRRNTQLLMIYYRAYETVGSDALASLGAKREELQLTVHSASMDQSCNFFEQPDLIAPALVFNKQHYSPEKQASIMGALENVINRLAAVEDPETATLAELLD